MSTLPNSDTQPYLLLTLIALSDEFPSAQVSRLPESESYKEIIVTQLKKEKMVPSIVTAFVVSNRPPQPNSCSCL